MGNHRPIDAFPDVGLAQGEAFARVSRMLLKKQALQILASSAQPADSSEA